MEWLIQYPKMGILEQFWWEKFSNILILDWLNFNLWITVFPDFSLTHLKFPDFSLTFWHFFKFPWLFPDWKKLSNFSRFSSVGGNPAWWADAGDCTVPAYEVWSNSDQFPWFQSDISLWEGVVVLKGVYFQSEYFLPREYFTLGGCAGPERTELEMVNRSDWACYLLIGRVCVTCIGLGGSIYDLELRAQQATPPCTVLKDLYAPWV